VFVLVGAVAALSTAVAALSLALHPARGERFDSAASSTPAPAPDPATPEAAASTAKAVVERSRLKAPNARVVAVTVKRLGRAVEQPRYEAEVVVETSVGPRSTARSQYLVTLQYAGAGEWQVEDVKAPTRPQAGNS
jgi:3-oxoacyl-ACP reductase-like protein